MSIKRFLGAWICMGAVLSIVFCGLCTVILFDGNSGDRWGWAASTVISIFIFLIGRKLMKSAYSPAAEPETSLFAIGEYLIRGGIIVMVYNLIGMLSMKHLGLIYFIIGSCIFALGYWLCENEKKKFLVSQPEVDVNTEDSAG